MSLNKTIAENHFDLYRYKKDIVTYHGVSPVSFERKSQSYQFNNRRKKLLNLIKEISYVGVSPQPQPLRQYIKQFCVVGTVYIAINLWISEREEVGFLKYSERENTHYPTLVGGFNL